MDPRGANKRSAVPTLQRRANLLRAENPVVSDELITKSLSAIVKAAMIFSQQIVDRAQALEKADESFDIGQFIASIDNARTSVRSSKDALRLPHLDDSRLVPAEMMPS